MATKESDIRIYWAGAKKYQIGNFRPEVREGGHIVTPEQPLTIYGHVITLDNNDTVGPTSGRKKIAFIEKSTAFRDGEVKLVESLVEANKLTTALQHSRNQQMQQNVDEVKETPEQVKIDTVASVSTSA